MTEYLIYLGGEFVKTKQSIVVKNPYDGKTIAETFLAGQKDLEEAILKAQSIQKKLAEMPSFLRHENLLKIAESIKKNKEHLASILSLESAKPIKLARTEIDRAATCFIVAAEESKRLPKEYISLDWTKSGERKEGLIKHFPIGLISGITPFNFPLNLAVHKIAPALASGNPIIIKPASSTPLSCLELAKIIDKTDFPKGCLSVLPMDRIQGETLVTDERFKMLSFTGSAEIGWKMKKNCGKKKIVLELGGNAAVIVCENANLDDVVSKCVVGAFAYSGQICIKVQRIFIHQSLAETFTEKLLSKIRELRPGNPIDENTDISVLINEEQAARVESWVNQAISHGANLLCGGKKSGAYYEPTVLSHTDKTMKVNCEEIFGPVVTLETFQTLEQAVEKVNETSFGLQAGIFTNSIKEMNFGFENIEAGAIVINDIPTLRLDHMPYGGIKDSGLGREGIKYAIAEMMEPRLLVKDY